jgi:hypothetical protein
MRLQGRTTPGFFPPPTVEAERPSNFLTFASEVSALNPCVGDSEAFATLLGV